MRCRESAVGRLYVNTVSNAAMLQIGDNREGNYLFSRVLAVQRSIASFGKDEFKFSSYHLFARPLPVAPAPSGPPVFFDSGSAPIEIGDIHITAVSAAAHVRIGSGGPDVGETRIVNIRNRIPGVVPRVKVDFD